MNSIIEIIENLKIEYKRINNIDPTQEEVSVFIGLKKQTLANYVIQSRIPHKNILEFCYKNKVNFKEIYYKKAKKICRDCPIEITDENAVWYTSRKGMRLQRRQCQKCYTTYRRDKKRELTTSKIESCMYCKKSFKEVERVFTEYITKRGNKALRPTPRCTICNKDEDLIKKVQLQNKREAYKKQQTELGRTILRGEEGYIHPERKISTQKVKPIRKVKIVSKKTEPKKVEKKVEKPKISEQKVEVKIVQPKMEKPTISKAKQAILDLMNKKEEQKKQARELSFEEKLIQEYLGE